MKKEMFIGALLMFGAYAAILALALLPVIFSNIYALLVIFLVVCGLLGAGQQAVGWYRNWRDLSTRDR